jgi:hypothetical protein
MFGDASQFTAQQASRTAQARHHGTGRNPQNLRSLFVSEFFHIHQQNHLAKLLWDPVQGSQNSFVGQAIRYRGRRRNSVLKLVFGIMRPEFQQFSSLMPDDIEHDSEQPGSHVCSRRKPLNRPQCRETRLLYDILGPAAVTRQVQRCPIQIVQMRQTRPFEVLYLFMPGHACSIPEMRKITLVSSLPKYTIS